MRSRIAVVGVVAAVCAAAAGIALAVAAVMAGDDPDVESTSEPVTATDFCYVESMIYYRVEASALADALLRKTTVAPEARKVAESLVADQSSELEDLRPWYVSWTGARPLEPPEEGPCAGHGDHAEMPGMPTPALWDELLAAEGAYAQRVFAQLLIVQNTAMIEFAMQVLEGDPHSLVRESAAKTIERAEGDIASLEDLLAGSP